MALGSGLTALHRLLDETLDSGDAMLVAPFVNRRDRRHALELHVAVLKVLRPRVELQTQLGRFQAVQVDVYCAWTPQELIVCL